jgi:hypothetical protein
LWIARSRRTTTDTDKLHGAALDQYRHPAPCRDGLRLNTFLEDDTIDYEKQVRVLAKLNFIIILLLANLVLNMGILIQVALMRSGK